MVKRIRQKKIVDIIATKPVETQYQLAMELNQAGFTVTQATVSRDIKELGLIKLPGKNNTSFYALPDKGTPLNREGRLRRLFTNSVQGLERSENLVIIKTLPGEAQGVASALDQADLPNIVGTVAGNDTVLVIVKSQSAAVDIVDRFTQLTGG